MDFKWFKTVFNILNHIHIPFYLGGIVIESACGVQSGQFVLYAHTKTSVIKLDLSSANSFCFILIILVPEANPITNTQNYSSKSHIHICKFNYVQKVKKLFICMNWMQSLLGFLMEKWLYNMIGSNG